MAAFMTTAPSGGTSLGSLQYCGACNRRPCTCVPQAAYFGQPMYTNPAPNISDEDIERIAQRVAEILREQKDAP